METIIMMITDALERDLVLYLSSIIILTLLAYLIYDFYTMKENQTNRMVSVRIGKMEKKKKYDIIGRITEILSNKNEKVELQLRKANVLLTVKEYLTMQSIAIVIGALAGLLLNPASVVFGTIFGNNFFGEEIMGRLGTGIILGYGASYLPFLWLQLLVSKRKKILATQISDALLNMADALKSGHVIQEAIRIVGMEMPYPIGPEFAKAHREMETGKTLEQSLRDLRDRINLEDFNMAINAIEIQYEVGGKLEPLLRNMVKIMNDRQELKKEIEKTIANSKTVGIVLLVAPWFFVIMFTMLDKETYMAMLQHILGLVIIGAAFVSYVIAAIIIVYIIKDVSKEI